MPIKFRHKAVPSALFGVVYRPIADVLAKTKDKGEWVSISMIIVTVQPSVIASGFCEAIPIVVGSNRCEAISELVIGDCFGTKNRASQ